MLEPWDPRSFGVRNDRARRISGIACPFPGKKDIFRSWIIGAVPTGRMSPMRRRSCSCQEWLFRCSFFGSGEGNAESYTGTWPVVWVFFRRRLGRCSSWATARNSSSIAPRRSLWRQRPRSRICFWERATPRGGTGRIPVRLFAGLRPVQAFQGVCLDDGLCRGGGRLGPRFCPGSSSKATRFCPGFLHGLGRGIGCADRPGRLEGRRQHGPFRRIPQGGGRKIAGKMRSLSRPCEHSQELICTHDLEGASSP